VAASVVEEDAVGFHEGFHLGLPHGQACAERMGEDEDWR